MWAALQAALAKQVGAAAFTTPLHCVPFATHDSRTKCTEKVKCVHIFLKCLGLYLSSHTMPEALFTFAVKLIKSG